MRILYIGSNNPNACASFYADAAEAMGHRVFRFDPMLFGSQTVLEKAWIGFTKSPLPNKVSAVGKKLTELCREHNFDIALNLAENFIPAFALQEIRALRNPPFLAYHSHDNNFSDGILKPKDFFETLRLYNTVYTTKSQNVAKYKALGQENSTFVPSAFEPSIHRPIPSTQSRYAKHPFAVTFVGTYDKSRDPLVDAVGWENLFVWGDRWKRFPGFRSHADHIKPFAIYQSEFADVLSHSRVSLGLLRKEAEDLHTQRTFEIPACRTLQIAPRNEEILSFFEEGKEIVCFDTPEELHDKTQYFLKHESERTKIANAGYERIYRDQHTYRDRVQTFLNQASKNRATRSR